MSYFNLIHAVHLLGEGCGSNLHLGDAVPDHQEKCIDDQITEHRGETSIMTCDLQGRIQGCRSEGHTLASVVEDNAWGNRFLCPFSLQRMH